MLHATYRANPMWQEAQRVLIDPPGDSGGERMVGSIKAAFALFELEQSRGPLTEEQRDRIAALLRTGGVS